MRSRLLPLAVTALLSAATLSAKEFQLGERADHDVLAPVAMDVINPAATEALKEKESQRVPAIYRFYPNAQNEVQAAFRSTFERTHSNFVEAVETRFGSRTLSAEDVVSNDFNRFLAQFQKQNILFPVGAALARTWAKGESDDEVEFALASRLRDAMKVYVRPDTAPKDIWVGSTIRVVPAADSETVTTQLIEERGFNQAKTNFMAVQRVKTDLVNSFPAEQRSVAKYLASFIKPNCTMEADLTRELRAQRTSGLVSATHYNAGQSIVKRGDVIDEKAFAALQQLKEKAAVSQLQKLEATTPEKLPKRSNALPWMIAAGIAAALIFITVFRRLSRPRARGTLLPVMASTAALELSSSSTNAEEAWRQRALLAEQQAQQAQTVVREGLLGQLAQWMSDKMTQKLVSQRSDLLSAQQRAAVEMAELEARLEKVHAPLQERLQAYEHRIADLEKELAIKGEENRELTKARIAIIRKQLEIEREKNRVEFN